MSDPKPPKYAEVDTMPPEWLSVVPHAWMPRHLTLAPCGITISLETGEVTIPEGLNLTAASREFWNAVAHMFPNAPEGSRGFGEL